MTVEDGVRVSARTVVGGRSTDLFLGVVAPASVQGAHAAYEEITRALTAHEATPFQERVYAPAALRDSIGAARLEALASVEADPNAPFAYLTSTDAISVQMWAIAGESSVVTVEACGSRGRLRELGDTRMLWVPAVRGDDQMSVTKQAEGMFENAEQILVELGFEVRDVARTWISVRRLLDWYGELNRVRTAFFAARGIGGGARDRPFPASTGVPGSSGAEECQMDLLAVRGARAVEALDASARQGAAFAYGSSFSRGARVELDGAALLFASGTASIAEDGRTLHAGSPELQAIETLLALAALLETRGSSLADIVSGALYHVDGAALAAYERAVRQLCMPRLPLLPVQASVCRRELALEIEAIAREPRAGDA